MPQTISLQRGSITLASNTTATTLFTNSASVTATRVIVNGLLITTSSSSGANGKFSGVGGALVVTPNGLGGTYMVGIVGATLSTGAFAQFPISNSPNSGANNIYDTSRARLYGISNTPIHSSTGVGNSFSSNVNGYASSQMVMGSTTSGTDPTNVQSMVSYCPQNFWIGPSDAVRFTPKTSLSYTAAAGKSPAVYYTDSYTVYYSFTLISES